jgi:hypothetical protein
MMNQQCSAIAIGFGAGQTNQQSNAIAIGFGAGQTNQGNGSVAIGTFSGVSSQGDVSIAIGTSAAAINNNSIVLNATWATIQSAGPGTFVATHIRETNYSSNVVPLSYSMDTCEIFYYPNSSIDKFYNTSARETKNITNLLANTARVYDLIPREYDLISDDSHTIGLISEEAANADPNFVRNDADGLPAGINWFNVLLYTVGELKASRDKIQELQARVDAWDTVFQK